MSTTTVESSAMTIPRREGLNRMCVWRPQEHLPLLSCPSWLEAELTQECFQTCPAGTRVVWLTSYTKCAPVLAQTLLLWGMQDGGSYQKWPFAQYTAVQVTQPMKTHATE